MNRFHVDIPAFCVYDSIIIVGADFAFLDFFARNPNSCALGGDNLAGRLGNPKLHSLFEAGMRPFSFPSHGTRGQSDHSKRARHVQYP